MKFKQSSNLDYYLEELVSYNYLMKKGSFFSFFQTGKSSMTFFVGKSEEDSFRTVKAWRAFQYFHRNGVGTVMQLSSRRSLWQVKYCFSQDQVKDWVVYFLDFFSKYVEAKGLRMRSFSASEGWFFLFRELGDLRFPGLYLDYYNWRHTWVVFLEKPNSDLLENRKLLYSVLKVRYKIRVPKSKKR